MLTHEETIEKIKSHPVYKKVMADSFGGVMYNVANRNAYDTAEIFKLWNSLAPGYQSAAGGIMNGAFNFLSGR